MASMGIATLGEITEFFGAIQTPKGQGFLGTEAEKSPVEWLSRLSGYNERPGNKHRGKYSRYNNLDHI